MANTNRMEKIMTKREVVEKKMKAIDGKGATIEVSYKGESVVPFFNTDLQFEAALSLLEFMDYKDFYENNQNELYDSYLSRLKEISDRLSNYE